MKIDEAVKEAMRVSGRIRRKSVCCSESKVYSEIFPTNSYDSCLIIVKIAKNEGVCSEGYRNWNPTADDLVADDWEVITA